MDARTFGRAVAALLIAVAVTLPQAGHALVVNAGFDLLHTPDATSFMGFTLSGVPIGSFDFGGPSAPGIRAMPTRSSSGSDQRQCPIPR